MESNLIVCSLNQLKVGIWEDFSGYFLETQKCKTNESTSIPWQQSSHLFAVCIFEVFPWLSWATYMTAMKRPGNTNDKIRNLSLQLGDGTKKKIDWNEYPASGTAISPHFKASRNLMTVTRQCEAVLKWEAVVAKLASARLSEREVSGSIFSDFNVCFDFPLFRVAIALNARNTEHWQRQGVKGAPSASINTSLVAEGTTVVK